jgi:Escherichia/Staphylococcus phage prohead protease
MRRSKDIQASNQEFRYWPTHIETRSEGAIRRIGGLGVPYNKRSRLLPGGFYEVVEPSAVRKTLVDNLNVVSRMEHHPEWLLATTDSAP